jgi:hypothetical protein
MFVAFVLLLISFCDRTNKKLKKLFFPNILIAYEQVSQK